MKEIWNFESETSTAPATTGHTEHCQSGPARLDWIWALSEVLQHAAGSLSFDGSSFHQLGAKVW
jgi:hypothetical protein